MSEESWYDTSDPARYRGLKFCGSNLVLVLVLVLQVAVQLLQAVQVELLLQLRRLAQVLQHLLRETAREAAADLIDHGALQPHVPLSQQPVPQVVPAQVGGGVWSDL